MLTTEGSEIVVFRNTYIHRPIADQRPTPLVVSAGQLAQFTATFASGVQPISYQWFKDGVQLTDGPTIIGADSSTLTIIPALALDAGLYTLRATNSAGEAFTRSVALAVIDNQGVPDTDLDDDGDLDIDDLQILIEGLEND